MINLASEQLFELCVLFVSAIIYIIIHFIFSGLAILISGQKSGVIRGFVQGSLLVAVFSLAVILFFNGKIKVYYVVTYVALVFALCKTISYINNKFKSRKLKRKIVSNNKEWIDKIKKGSKK